MPGKTCFATVLAFLLLAGRSPAQQSVSSSFVAAVSADLAASSQTVTLPGRIASARSQGEPPGLVQPAILQTPDRYTPSVQQTSHRVPSGDILSDEDPVSQPEEPEGFTELSDLTQSAKSERDSRFPSLAPSEKPRSGGSAETQPVGNLAAVLTVISSLAVVLGLFFITAWLLRRTGAGGLITLPSDVFELLGRAQLTSRQQVQLLRCGTKLLLVSVTPDSAETLTEIDDPDEVTRLAALCKANQAGSATAAFRQVLHQFAKQPVEPGFVGRDDLAASRARLPSGLENLHG